MTHIKTAGVYMIRNTVNGKVYIGSTSDIRERWKVHRWTAVSTTLKPNVAKRPIVIALREFGLDNFEFILLESGPDLEDKNTRLLTETLYIAKYKSDLPEYGYNFLSGFAEDRKKFKREYRRKHTPSDIYKRCKPIIEYDIETKHMILYPGGANAWGNHRGYGKDVASHTVNRGSIIADKYYLVFADYDSRHELLDKMRKRRDKGIDKVPQKSVTLRKNVYKKYKAVVEYIDKHWCEG